MNTPVNMPRAMLFVIWAWDEPTDKITVTVDIQNDIEYRDDHGLYFIACTPFTIGGTGAYFGLQTNVSDGLGGQLGKGAIFSMWDTQDAGDARVPDGGVIEVGAYEGEFASVRRPYVWGEGRYTLRLVAQESDSVGRWYALTVNDTWIGSLRFPLVDGKAKIQPYCGSTIEVYGGPPVKPVDVPYWSILVAPPEANGQTATVERTYYPSNVESLRNALITREDAGVRLEVGLGYLAHE